MGEINFSLNVSENTMGAGAHQILEKLMLMMEQTGYPGGYADLDGPAQRASDGAMNIRTFRISIADITDREPCIFCDGRGMVAKSGA